MLLWLNNFRSEQLDATIDRVKEGLETEVIHVMFSLRTVVALGPS